MKLREKRGGGLLSALVTSVEHSRDFSAKVTIIFMYSRVTAGRAKVNESLWWPIEECITYSKSKQLIIAWNEST